MHFYIFALKVIPNNNNNKRANVQMGGKATWKIKFARHKTWRALPLSDPVKFLPDPDFRAISTIAPKFELINVESAIRGGRVKLYEKRNRSLST